MKSITKSRIFFIIAMLIFGTIAIFVRNINVSSGELALYRAILAAIIIGIFLLITKQKFNFKESKKDVILIIISGMAMGFNWVLLFEAYKYTTISIATLTYYFAPIIVTIVSSFIFKEKLTIIQIICFVASTVGIILITDFTNKNTTNNSLFGILFGLSAAIFYASVMILNKCTKSIAGVQRTFLQFISAIVVLLPYVLLTTGINLLSMNTMSWINLLIIGIIHTGITYCLYFSALKELPGQEAAILSYVDPIIAIIISFTIFSETMTILQIIGGLLIIAFTIINEININKKEKKE